MKDVEFDAALLETIRSLPKDQRHEIGSAIAAAQEIFGQPHRHAGLGLRKVAGGHYEIRLSRGQRLVFEEKRHALYFKLLGNHDDVARLLKNL